MAASLLHQSGPHACVDGYLLRLPKPMQAPKRSSSNPPGMCSRRCCRVSPSTAWICSLHVLLLLIVRSCHMRACPCAHQVTNCMHDDSPQGMICVPECEREFAHLWQCHKEWLYICAQVSSSRQVSVNFPSLPKLLEAVIKFAGNHNLSGDKAPDRQLHRPAM